MACEVKSSSTNYFLKRCCILLLFLLSGCIEEVELNDKVLVAMVGIDQTEEGKIILSFGVIDARLIEEKKSVAVHVYTTEADSVFEAARLAILKIGKHPQWPYIKVLVFGPSFKKEDVVPMLDFFNRNNEVQPNPYIAFSQVPAQEIVNLKANLGNIPADIVEKKFNLQELIAAAPTIRLHQFTEMMLTTKKVGFAAIIEKIDETGVQIPKVGGSAIIKEGKWIGSLSSEETRGILWVRDEVQGGIITVPSLDGKGKIGLEILDRGKVKITPLLKNDELSVQIKIKHALSVVEIMAYMDSGAEKLEEINKLAEQEIKREIETSLKKMKEWQTDLYEIDRAIHRKYPKYWREHREEWGEIFAEIPIDVKVELKIKMVGLLKPMPKVNQEGT